MFRTRDFLLFLVAIVFLVVAISTTSWLHFLDSRNGSSVAIPEFAQTSDADVEAVVEESSLEEERAARLKMMREKLADRGEVIAAAPPEEIIIDEEITESTDSTNEVTTELRCDSYVPYGGAWDPSFIAFEEVEGARLVYRDLITQSGELPLGEVPTTLMAREVLVQLAVRSVPLPTTSCIPSDVIGIATDGSLIRNTEIGLYGVFGESTLIGYALDGFPIYGTTDAPVDECGGRVVGGQYQYNVSTERETILHCYKGVPASL